jgi:hypothetical protein
VRALALVELAAGRPAEALAPTRHAVALARQICDRRVEVLTLSALGARDRAPGRHPDHDAARPRRAVDGGAGRRLTGAWLIGE